MISVTDSLNPVTGGAADLSRRGDIQQLLELEHPLPGGGVLHHRLHTFKVGFNNAYLHHENTTYSAPATPYSYGFTSMVPTSITYRIVPRTVEVNVDRDMGFFVQDKWTTGRWTLAGAIRLDSFKNSFPQQAIVGTFFGRNLNVSYHRDREFELERHHAEIGCDLRRIWKREDGVEGDAQQVSRRPGHDGIRPRAGVGCAQSHPASGEPDHAAHWADGNRNFVPDCDLNNFAPMVSAGGRQSELRHRHPGHHLRPGPDARMGQASLQLGVHDQRPAGNHSSHVGRGAVARRWCGNIRVMDDLARRRRATRQSRLRRPLTRDCRTAVDTR